MCLDQFSFNDLVFGSFFLENSFIYRFTVSNDTIVVALFEFLCSKLKYNLWLIQFVKLCKCSFIVLLQSYIIHKFTEHIPQNWSWMCAYRKRFVWSNPIDVWYGTSVSTCERLNIPWRSMHSREFPRWNNWAAHRIFTRTHRLFDVRYATIKSFDLIDWIASNHT